MKHSCDIAIAGSGFGGALLAMIARRLGRSIILIERGTHPRFAIGESTTPLTNLLLEEIASRYQLPRVGSLSKWGTWQRDHPQIACGLKRGFTFYHHEWNQPWRENRDKWNPLLVAASPYDRVADTHWLRADVDHFLVQEATALGAEYIDQTIITDLKLTANGVRLFGSRLGETVEVRAKFLVDATGPRGLAFQHGLISESSLQCMPPTQGIYSHFINVAKLSDVAPLSDARPYPVDDAAVHHVFPGGWIWVLRFNNGITSAGAAFTRDVGAVQWNDLLKSFPTVEAQFRDAKPVMPFVHAKQLGFRASDSAGDCWAMLPSAAGFVDPLLSTGFPLTLLGVFRLGEILEQHWDRGNLSAALADYDRKTMEELARVERLVAGLFSTMNNPRKFGSLSLLYFAAASFSEAIARLTSARPDSFLLGSAPQFQAGVDYCLKHAAHSSDDELLRMIERVIEPFDVAGLCKFDRCGWYPFRANDLMEARAKLGAAEADIHRLLKRCDLK